jgi:hypothetical protein
MTILRIDEQPTPFGGRECGARRATNVCWYKQYVSIAEWRRTHTIKGLSSQKLNRIVFMWIADSFPGRVFETPQDIDVCRLRLFVCVNGASPARQDGTANADRCTVWFNPKQTTRWSDTHG